VNGVYDLTNFNVRDESGKYVSGTGLGKQIILNSQSTISPMENSADIPSIPFDFINLTEIEDAPVKQKIGISNFLISEIGLTLKSFTIVNHFNQTLLELLCINGMRKQLARDM
jgi:hypothetical protein